MEIEFEFFDPRYAMFNIGISLERYEEKDEHYKWVKRQVVLGFLIFNININWLVDLEEIGE